MNCWNDSFSYYNLGINGSLPPRLRNERIWNSTAYLQGKPGNNIVLDLVNEFLNNEFKCKFQNTSFKLLCMIIILFVYVQFTIIYTSILPANLKNCHGQYSESQVSRCSKIVGTVGKSLENVFQNELIQSYIPNASATGGSSRQKIKKFVEEYHNGGLFEDRGERFHSGFENFKHKVVVKNPEKLHARLLKYVKSLENEEYVYKE